jgi:hypothetical protein
VKKSANSPFIIVSQFQISFRKIRITSSSKFSSSLQVRECKLDLALKKIGMGKSKIK